MSVKNVLPRGVERLRKRHVIYVACVAILLLASSVSLLRLSPYKPNEGPSLYFRAKVVSVQVFSPGGIGPEQEVHARLLDGPQKRQTVEVTRNISFGDQAARRLPIGSEILLFKDGASDRYSFLSRWYMPGIATLFTILFAIVIILGAWRGITGILGLSISICILAVFVIPRVINGANAFTTCIEAALLITLVSLYIAHGFTRRTTVACMSSLVTLAAVVGLTAFASYVTGTSEVVDESSVGILYATHPIDIGGLLTGSVVIASLGTLYDITTGQAAIIDELHKTRRKLKTAQLFWKGMSVGREHIAALINTLALVYVGVALPSIITTIILNQQNSYHPPLLVNLNTETIAEEVVRTSVASIGMLLALPVTTWLAAYLLPRWTVKTDKRIRQWIEAHW